MEAINQQGVSVIVTERALAEATKGALPCAVAQGEHCAGLVVELTGERDCRGAAAVRRARESGAEVFVIAVASSISRAVTQQAVRLRIDDFFLLPDEAEQLRAAVAVRLEGRESEPKSAREPHALRGSSPQIETLRRYVDRVALADSSVLITGETGSGKELVAEMLHRQGSRRNGPFVSVNAAALPESLFESEMFGYERGAFTGANGRHVGKLRQAHRGTIFFDEIGDLGASSQVKLLRALETREVTPLGGDSGSAVDVRVIAATNRDLESMTALGTFRADLFYRLNVVRIEMPSLRARAGDIPELARHFLETFNQRFGRRARFDQESLELLSRYEFPGNVRELKNVVEATLVSSATDLIGACDLPLLVRRFVRGRDPREDLLATLAATKWNISRAASKLQCSRMTVYRRLAEYRIERQKLPATG